MKGMIIAFSHFDTGGLQTLMVRMAKWCKINAIKNILICDSSDENMISICQKENIEILKSFKKEVIRREISKFIEDVDETILVTFELPEFLYFERICTKNFKGKKINHYIYNVSVSGMIYGKDFKGIIGKIIYSFYKKQVEKFYNNKQVIFMDVETQESALNYYCIQQHEWQDIFLLPMFISEEPQEKSTSNSKQVKSILTVARAVFPYKGYMIGLIDDFSKLCQNHDDIILEIVSFGEDINQLKEKILQQEPEVQKKIIIFDKLSLQDIRKILKRTYVYIGMGTTVLDAADEGVPSIVSWHSTMENICTGYFYDNPIVIGKAGEGMSGYSLLDSILLLSDKEYKRLCKKTYSVYKENYNIDIILGRLFKRRINRRKILLTNAEYYFHCFFWTLRKLRRKVIYNK